jgi:hypothetical protein
MGLIAVGLIAVGLNNCVTFHSFHRLFPRPECAVQTQVERVEAGIAGLN